FPLVTLLFFFLLLLPRPTSTLFPYTTLFRSVLNHRDQMLVLRLSLTIVACRRFRLQIDENLLPFGLPFHKRVLDARLHGLGASIDRKSTRLNSSHVAISYAVFCLKKKKFTTK